VTHDADGAWLTELAERGDRMVSELYGYDSLPATWTVGFPAGLPEHLIYLLVAGSITGEIAGDRVDLRAGTLLWVPPRTPFRLHATGQRSARLYRCRLRPGAAPDATVRLIHDAWPLREPMAALVAELGGALDHRAERVRALLVVLFTSILRLRRASAGSEPLPESIRDKVESYVEQRVTDRPTGAELASVAGLSADYFARRFRATYGIAPRQWLVRQRIRHAMQRLEESEDSISAVARQCGYPDVYLFSRQFAAVVGVAPRVWRASRQLDHSMRLTH